MKKKYIIPEIEEKVISSDVQLLEGSEPSTIETGDMDAKQAGGVEEDFKSHFSDFGKSLWGDEEDED